MSRQHATPTKSTPSKGGSGGAGKAPTSARTSTAAQAPLEQDPAFSNSFMAQTLLTSAIEQEGAEPGQVDLFGAAMGGKEDPDKYWFAEDGDDLAPKTGGRAQQKDALPALRPKHEGSQVEDFTKGKAFVKGEGDQHAVDPHDVKQGALGDCYLIAGMAAVARADPKAIQKLIKDNGDGTFDVTLHIRKSPYSRPTPVTKTVDARLAVKGAGRPLYAGLGDVTAEEQELWTALIEKTVAQHKNSYDLISGGNINGHGFNFAGATELLTGRTEGYFRTDGMDADTALLTIQIALDEGKPVTVDSRNLESDAELTREANGRNVYWNHAYAPEEVDLNGGKLDLQNPWGSDHVNDLPVDLFLKYYRSIRVGA